MSTEHFKNIGIFIAIFIGQWLSDTFPTIMVFVKTGIYILGAMLIAETISIIHNTHKVMITLLKVIRNAIFKLEKDDGEECGRKPTERESE